MTRIFAMILFKSMNLHSIIPTVVMVVLCTSPLALAQGQPSQNASADKKLGDKASMGGKGSDRVITVSTIPLIKTTGFEVKRQFTGQIEPRRKSQLGFDRIGRIAEMLVDRGDSVEVGQLVARLDVESLQASKKKLEADLRSARALLQEAEEGPRKETIAVARASLAEQQSQMDFAMENLRRRENLLQKKLVAREEYESALAAKSRWEAQVESAQCRLDELLAGTRPERIESQRAQVSAIEAALNQVDVEIAKSSIYSPYQGTILTRDLDIGSVVSPGHPVVSMVEDRKLEARIGIAQSLGKSLKKGDAIEVDCNGEIFQGTVRAIVSERDATTRTQAIIVSLPDNAWTKAIAGDIARVSLKLENQATGYWVPTESLIAGARGLWNCFVIEKTDSQGMGTATIRVVELIHSDGDRSLISGNFADGEQIVSTAPHRITAGQNVRVRTSGDNP